MAKYLLGLDYGTGGMKGCLTDQDLNILAYSFREFRILTENNGWCEHDANDYWVKTCECIKECIASSRINPNQILGVSLSGAMPSLVMIDKKGQVINNAYNLMDKRATKEVELVKDIIGEKEYFQINGNRLEDHPGIVNLLWEKKNRIESYNNIFKALSTVGYIKYKLTGLYNENFSTATFLGAYDIRENKFNNEIFEQLDIDPELLPSVTPCEAIIGTVSEEAALDTGLSKKTCVVSGQVDACAGWLGGGAVKPGDIQMNLGTCGNFGIINDGTIFERAMGINCAYTIDGMYVVIPTTTTGGQLVRYMRDNFSPLEVAVEKETGIDAYDLLNLEADKIPAGSEGLIILPYLMGERSPLWDVNARGVIFGLSLNHTKAHVVRAMMESVAYALYNSFEIIKDNFNDINFPIVLNEGGAKSQLWRSIITHVFDIPTVLLKSRVGAPYGNCILAGKACKLFHDFDIAHEKAEYIDLLEPDSRLHDMYMDYYQSFKNIYNQVKNNFCELKNIREKYL